MARYNFSNFLVRNFNIETDNDNGISRMIVSGFLNYDEALQYARKLYSPTGIGDKLAGCRRIIISTDNLKLLGTRYSYNEYEEFFDKAFAPLPENNLPLLMEPESLEPDDEPLGSGYPEYNEKEPTVTEQPQETKTTDTPNIPQQKEKVEGNDMPQNITTDFDDDFYR